MKKLKGNLAVRWLAVILLTAFAVGAVFAGIGAAILFSVGAYDSRVSEEDLVSNAVADWGISRSYQIANNFSWSHFDEDETEWFERENKRYPGFCFQLLDENGETVFDGLDGRKTQWKSDPIGFEVDMTYVVTPEATPMPEATPVPTATAAPTAIPEPTATTSPAEDAELPEDAELAEDAETGEAGTQGTPHYDGSEAGLAAPPTPRPTAGVVVSQMELSNGNADEAYYAVTVEATKEYRLVGYVLSELPENSELAYQLEYLSNMYIHRMELLQGTVAGLVAALLLFAFLMASAGHRNGVEGIQSGFTEKIPFDLFTAGIVCAGTMLLIGGTELASVRNQQWVVLATVIALFGAAFVLVCLWWCMSFAVRLKQRTVIRSCLCYKILAWCWRIVKRCWGFVMETARGLPLIGKAVLVIAAILLVEFVYTGMFCGDGMLFFGWFVERSVLVMLTVYTLICMKRLLIAGKEIADGKLDYTVDTTRMYGPFKEHAESLNNITAGLNRAVGERMKSERFRTELITNVSHDIKTPLTSIINYVDLMEKEEPENEKMREYLEVLSRQSARLKKLIDDLMEASKASSGALNVNPEPCQLGVLIDQCTGEYAEKLAAKGLELITAKPETPVTIMADGRHMWRIFDNLLNNICKYAQSGTRVYIDLEQRDGRAVVTVKNISASRLNFNGDELMERFVRGDLSRNTEGSGLGLSIAQSLTKLQGGEMTLTVDGDLFKVQLSFKEKV